MVLYTRIYILSMKLNKQGNVLSSLRDIYYKVLLYVI